jgi:hypothetical protein
MESQRKAEVEVWRENTTTTTTIMKDNSSATLMFSGGLRRQNGNVSRRRHMSELRSEVQIALTNSPTRRNSSKKKKFAFAVAFATCSTGSAATHHYEPRRAGGS